MNPGLFFLVILVLVALYSSSVFAEDNFAFFLDKSQYQQRDVIEVSGWVTKVNGTDVFIEIINPNDKIVFQEISKLEDTQKIEHRIPTFGGDWNNPGFYTIRVNYQNETHSRLFAFGNFNLEEFEPQISLDKEVYSWTDPVQIEVLSPNDNQNNYQIDKIKVDVSAGLSTLKSYTLEETGKTDGIFTGMITLTGDSNFDVDGDGKRGDAPGYTFGLGPDEGYLDARANDLLKIRFSSPHFENTVEKTVPIQFHLAKIEWVEDPIDPNQKAAVRVIDPDLMLYPTRKDETQVYVSALPNGYSWPFVLTETENNSGIFEGYVTLHQWPREDGVVVGSGTEVSVKYIDRTLPPNVSLNSMNVVDIAKVIKLDYPWDLIPNGTVIKIPPPIPQNTNDTEPSNPQTSPVNSIDTQRAEKLIALGNFYGLLSYSVEILENNPEDTDALFYRSFAWLQLKRYTVAIESFKKLIAVKPDNSEAYYYIATAYHDEHKYEQSLIAIKEAIKINPLDVKYYNQKGKTEFFLNEFEQAIDSFDKALELEPTSETAFEWKLDSLDELGIIYLDQNEYNVAEEYFDKILDLDIEYPDAWKNKGVVAFEQGDYESAITFYEKYLEFYPDDIGALESKKQALKEVEKPNQTQTTGSSPSSVNPLPKPGSDSSVNWAGIAVELGIFAIVGGGSLLAAYLKKRRKSKIKKQPV